MAMLILKKFRSQRDNQSKEQSGKSACKVVKEDSQVNMSHFQARQAPVEAIDRQT
jgi:hypothetical protein